MPPVYPRFSRTAGVKPTAPDRLDAEALLRRAIKRGANNPGLQMRRYLDDELRLAQADPNPAQPYDTVSDTNAFHGTYGLKYYGQKNDALNKWEATWSISDGDPPPSGTSYVVQQIERHFDVTLPDGRRINPTDYFEELFEVEGGNRATKDRDTWEADSDEWVEKFGEGATGTITIVGRATYYPHMKTPPEGFTRGGHPGSGDLYSIPRPGGVWGEYEGPRSNARERTMTFTFP